MQVLGCVCASEVVVSLSANIMTAALAWAQLAAAAAAAVVGTTAATCTLRLGTP